MFRLDDRTNIVETVDVITPVVNDPFLFGAIAAINSLSDIYAMGGTPLTALAIVGFPACEIEKDAVRKILEGAVSAMNRASVRLMGGHSFDDPELRFGLSVTGTVKLEEILRKDGARAGDLLLITKPLGTGILTTALKGGRLEDRDLEEAVQWMLTLNSEASRAAVIGGAHAATDITGFGLLGHAYNMARGTSVDFVFRMDDIPFMNRVREMAERGIIPAGAHANLDHLQASGSLVSDLDELDLLILADPQTSGGLLIALPEEGLTVFRENTDYLAIVGEVREGSGMLKVA